jgi:YesN/AraC family two-component response regulator
MARTILVADDNQRIREMLYRMFEAEVGYEVCAEAANGEEAITLALKHRPQLIIMDLSMPVMNGLEASREVKRLMPDVQIILFTQHSDVGVQLFGPNMPFDRIVSKVDVQELMGHVRSLSPG